MQTYEFYNQHKVELILACLGIFFILLGGFGYFKPIIFPSSVIVLGKNTETKELTVDIQGAVVRPGVYKMLVGSRIDDLLKFAGGLTENTDSKWTEINLNRAKKVSDGEKVYIPFKNDQSSIINGQSKLININAATGKELEAVAGIGPSTAEKIIKGRPYQDLAELVSRKIISAKLYSQIKDQLSVW